MFPSRLRRYAEPPPPSAPSPTPTPTPSKRTLPYMQHIARLSQRTGTPLPSLLLSFGILHELTALAPLFGFFFASRWLGLGQQTVQWAARGEGIGGETVRRWTAEGEEWAERVGSRYGLWGYEKLGREERGRWREERKRRRADGQGEGEGAGELGTRIAGDVANAVVAYGLTKAVFPLRIGLSLYLSPWFSRSAVEPVRKVVWRLFRRK